MNLEYYHRLSINQKITIKELITSKRFRDYYGIKNHEHFMCLNIIHAIDNNFYDAIEIFFDIFLGEEVYPCV